MLTRVAVNWITYCHFTQPARDSVVTSIVYAKREQLRVVFVTVPGFCNSVGGGSFFGHTTMVAKYHSAAGRQPS